MLQFTINKNLDELINLMEQLDAKSYQQPITSLSNATIGGHTRHIIEMYLCLIEGYKNGIVNYDNRKRDKTIELNKESAIKKLRDIKTKIAENDKNILLQNTFNIGPVITKSSYQRELLYNLEHSIHHQALIKVALLEIQYDLVDEDFGVAQSTIEYRKKCVQ